MVEKGSNDTSKKKKGEKRVEEKEKKDDTPTVVSEELVRWMTEGTHPNQIPRSDCG